MQHFLSTFRSYSRSGLVKADVQVGQHHSRSMIAMNSRIYTSKKRLIQGMVKLVRAYYWYQNQRKQVSSQGDKLMQHHQGSELGYINCRRTSSFCYTFRELYLILREIKPGVHLSEQTGNSIIHLINLPITSFDLKA